jgi:transcriptional regulator with XRE-family HTH domain
MIKTATINDVKVQESSPTDMEIEDLGKEEQKSRFIYLRAKGYSLAKIAKELHISKGTLSNWSHEFEEKIARTRAIELEVLQEEYFLLKEGRIKLLGDQLKAIQKEISSRDLSKFSTDRLLEFQLRYFGELKTEYIETRQGYKIGTKLNSGNIAHQLESVLIQYKTGEISEAQAKLEQAILQSMLKAIEQTELETRLERLEALLKSRR